MAVLWILLMDIINNFTIIVDINSFTVRTHYYLIIYNITNITTKLQEVSAALALTLLSIM